MIDLTIARLGSDGVGVGRVDGRVLLVPGALPGERVRVRHVAGAESAILAERLSAHPDRIEPPCVHFAQCGGCALQHLAWEPYLAFKRQQVIAALARQGLGDVPVAPIHASPPGSRRRATMEAKRTAAGVVLGFHARGSHQIIDLAHCPVLVPEFIDLLAPLRELLASFLARRAGASISLTLAPGGIDLGLALPAAPDLEGFERLAAFAEAADLARLWWRVGEGAPVPVATRRSLDFRFGTVAVAPPAGGFLQATAEGEAALTAAVVAALAGADRIADLFAGCGTFGLALGPRAALHAVEQDGDALAALRAAARRAGYGHVTTERRDLDARPLLASELKPFDAVLFDPPRAGAGPQAALLAASNVGVVVAVSCNPATFARDARTLVDGGYQMDAVLPVDQFVWSPHVEMVARFRR